MDGSIKISVHVVKHGFKFQRLKLAAMDKTFRKFEQGLDSWAAEMKLIIPTAFDNVKKDNFLGQTSNELQKEIAAVKDMLSDIVVSIQSANDKITRISEVIASNTLSNWDSNNNSRNNNNSNDVKIDSCLSKNRSKSSSRSGKSSGQSDSSGESDSCGESESGGESDGRSNSVSSGNSKRRRRRKMKRKNEFKSDINDFTSSNSRSYRSTDNNNKQSDAHLQDLKRLKTWRKKFNH